MTSTLPVLLRPMTMSDVDAVFTIEKKAMPSPTPWPLSLFVKCLQIGYEAFVAESKSDQLVIGFCLMSVAAGEAHILSLAVLPAYQGQGVGRQLLNQLMQIANEQQLSRVFLEVRIDNTVAISLYEKAGFHQIGLRKGYYPNQFGLPEDALTFSLEAPFDLN